MQELLQELPPPVKKKVRVLPSFLFSFLPLLLTTVLPRPWPLRPGGGSYPMISETAY